MTPILTPTVCPSVRLNSASRYTPERLGIYLLARHHTLSEVHYKPLKPDREETISPHFANFPSSAQSHSTFFLSLTRRSHALPGSWHGWGLSRGYGQEMGIYGGWVSRKHEVVCSMFGVPQSIMARVSSWSSCAKHNVIISSDEILE